MIASLLDFHFLRPAWLLLLPLLALLGWRLQRVNVRSSWQRLIAPHLLPHLLVKGGDRAGGVTGLLALLCIACLAAAGPTWTREPQPFAERLAPLLIAVDLSTAMDTGEHLERAKLKLRDLLARRQGARNALLVYAGSAHLLLPPTDDEQLFSLYLDSLATDLMPRPGKDSGAVLEAMDRLQSGSEQPLMRLLVTAEVEAGAVDRINASHTVIWAVHAGGDTLPAALRGPVVEMQADDSDLDRLDRALDASLRQAPDDDSARWLDRGWWLLWPVALLLLLRLRRAAPALLLLPLLGNPAPAQAAGFELWQLWRTPDQQAAHLFEQGDFRLAAELFSTPAWRGIALYRAGDYQAALAEFEQGRDALACYNQGNALAQLERYPEAAERYQLALSQAPRWTEAQENFDLALRLASQQRDDAERGETGDPPDEIRFDLDKNRGTTATQLQSREEQARLWLEGLEAGPAGFLRQRMAVQLKQQETQP